MNRIRTKLVLLLLVVIIVPLIAVYVMVKGLIDESFEVGYNEQVVHAIEKGFDYSRELYSLKRKEIVQQTEALADSNTLLAILNQNFDIRSTSFHRIDVFDEFGNVKQIIKDSSTTTPKPDFSSIQNLLRAKQTRVISSSERNLVPVFIYQNSMGFVFTSTLDKEFTDNLSHIIDVNQNLKAIDMFSDGLLRLYFVRFLLLYLPIPIFAIGLGIFLSRKITQPLAELSKATTIVAEGNWNYRLKVSTRDEIGQLERAFNEMLETIEENRRLAQEEETERRRIEKENNLKAIELEKKKELEKMYSALEKSHNDLQQAQAQLIQSAKMASLGNLAAGVAHEINNPVGAINSAADVTNRAMNKLKECLNDIQTKDENCVRIIEKSMSVLEENTRIIQTGSSRVVKIVKSLKTFARLDEAKFTEADVHEGMDSTLMLLHHQLKNRITVHKSYAAEGVIQCYPDELNQVFMNIFSNAAHAINEDGEIHISTENRDGQLIIKIRDTGSGISQENVAKIFDPGFTTKGVGIGTGLGLSISYQIIEKHCGEISVKSEVGAGTEFTISLPRGLKEE